MDGKKSFTCQHGPDECYGNKVHSCVLDLLSIDKSLQYIACAEAGSSPTDDANFEAVRFSTKNKKHTIKSDILVCRKY